MIYPISLERTFPGGVEFKHQSGLLSVWFDHWWYEEEGREVEWQDNLPLAPGARERSLHERLAWDERIIVIDSEHGWDKRLPGNRPGDFILYVTLITHMWAMTDLLFQETPFMAYLKAKATGEQPTTITTKKGSPSAPLRRQHRNREAEEVEAADEEEVRQEGSSRTKGR